MKTHLSIKVPEANRQTDGIGLHDSAAGALLRTADACEEMQVADNRAAAPPSRFCVGESLQLCLGFLHFQSPQVFHIVDQLSGWSEFCHRQYREHLGPFSAKEEAMLDRYRQVRADHPWEDPMERRFYCTSNFEKAVEKSVARKQLTNAQGKDLLQTMQHFARRFKPWLDVENERLRKKEAVFGQALASHASWIEKLMCFFGVSDPQHVPTLLVPNPSNEHIGAGVYSGVMGLEVPPSKEITATIIHELAHVFMRSLDQELEMAGSVEIGLNRETLEEGIAHAIAPGLFSDENEGNELEATVDRLLREGRTFADPFLRFNFLGLMLRPHLKDALEEISSASDFLQTAIDVWGELPLDDRRAAASF